MTKQFQLGRTERKRSKKLLIVAGLLLLIIAAGATYWFVFRDNSAPVDENATDPTLTSAKEEAAEVTETKTNDSNNSQTVTADQVPSSPSLSISGLTTSQSGGYVTAEATIGGATQSGSCVFTFTATDSRPVVKQSSGTTSCSTRIAEVEFDKVGTWNLEVSFFQNNTKASASQNVTIN